jgi:hypothetical protein
MSSLLRGVRLAFNGYNRATVLAVLAYFVVGLVLGHDHPTSYRLRVLFVMLPAVPITGLFSVALVRESDLPSALWWSGGLVVASLLAASGGAVGAWHARREADAASRSGG